MNLNKRTHSDSFVDPDRDSLMTFNSKQMSKIAEMEITISEQKSFLESKDKIIRRLQNEIGNLKSQISENGVCHDDF
jgi:hypothetical protein